MLGSAPQLQDAPGVAYLCGDCGELKEEEEGGVMKEKEEMSAIRRRRRRPMHLVSSSPFGRPRSSCLSGSIVPRGLKQSSLTRASRGMEQRGRLVP